MAREAGVKRIAIVGPSGRSLVKSRGALIRDLIAERHRVLCLAPDMTSSEAAALAKLGAEQRVWSFKPSRLRMLADRHELAGLREIFRDFEPHAVMAYGPHTLEVGALAAKAADVARIVALINGLPGGRERLEGRAGRRLRQALSAAGAAIFHNLDDQRACTDLRLLPASLSQTVVPGSGVDVSAFAAAPLPPLGQGLVFLMIATLDAQRGVRDYCEAAREIKSRAPNAQFLLAGPLPPDGGAMANEIEAFAGVVEYLGLLEDVRAALARAHVFVYPSYGEGMPAAVLEALATGRPVITTNTPGCRDTVDAGVNGSVVPPGDPQELAAAMGSFLKRPDLIPSAARASRSKAERRFDQREVNRALIPVLVG